MFSFFEMLDLFFFTGLEQCPPSVQPLSTACTKGVLQVVSLNSYSVQCRSHTDEVLDVAFDCTGQWFASACVDGVIKVFDSTTTEIIATLEGHEADVTKIVFSPCGDRLLSASSDRTARIWDVSTGTCLQVLEGHSEELIACAFNYHGDIVLTGSKDNTVRIWR
eukprot:m.47792 g.47792  ORF g.47792 m.47792 type:complete len:164 (-) comp12352_c0_seq1:298-789(-)